MLDEDGKDIHLTLTSDPAAFRGLVERHQDRLYDLALRMTGDRAEAEDIVQEAFVRIFRSLERFDSRASFSTWAYAITLNLTRSRLRRRALRRFFGLETVPEPAEPEQEPDRVLEGRAGKARLDGALAALPAAARELVLLHYIHGLPLSELAQATGLSLSAVKVRLFRARLRMAERLGDRSQK